MRISKLCLVVCAVTLVRCIPDCPRRRQPRSSRRPRGAGGTNARIGHATGADECASARTRDAGATGPACRHDAGSSRRQPAVATPPPAMETNQSAAPAATMPPTNVTNVPQAQPPPVAVTPSGATVPPPTNPPAATTPAMTPAPGVAPAQTTAPAASTASSSGNSLFGPVPPPSGGTPAGAMPEESTPSSTTSAAPTAVQIPAPAPVQSLPMEPSQNNNSATTPGKALGLKPIVAPPLPISATNKRNSRPCWRNTRPARITPVQYQTERAKILNQSR